MPWQDSVVSLGGVALGGAIAAFAGSRSARRSNTAAALQALADMRNLRLTSTDDAGLPDSALIRRARADLLIGGAPWVLVEMHERAVRAALLGTWSISRSLKSEESERQRRYAQAVFHPARFSTRPIMRIGDALEQAIAESLERPFTSAVFGPWRRARLRSLVRRVARENEVTRFPPHADETGEHMWQLTAVDPVTRWLRWPKRRAMTRGSERLEQSRSWYPASARHLDDTSD